MCQFISFLHRPDNGDVKVYDLTSHSKTAKHYGIKPSIGGGLYLSEKVRKELKDDKKC